MSMHVRNKPHFHEAMRRAGYEMPSINSALCSLEFMFGVRENYFYCIKSNDPEIRRQCYSHPPKKDLIKKLNDELRPIIDAGEHDDSETKPVANLLSLMETSPPDVNWLLKVVSKFCPDDIIFKKSYKYTKPKDEDEETRIRNDDGFWDG